MGIHIPLLCAFLRQALPVTLPAVGVALVFLLGRREPLAGSDAWPFLFIVVHSLAVVQRIDSFHSGWFAFCRTRGFSSRALAAHGLLAAFISVLLVWALAAMSVVTGLRAGFQDAVMRNPYGPFLRLTEYRLPLIWLCVYAVVIPVFHYALVRRAQPTRGMENGSLLALVFGIAWGLLFLEYPHPLFQWIIWGVGGAYALICLIGAIGLHRRLEVRS